MAHWRHPPQAAAGLPFGVWWAIVEALAVAALMLSLRLFRLI